MTNLNEMKTTELKEMAKELKIKNWWTLNKATLITEIELLQKPVELPQLTKLEQIAMSEIPVNEFYEDGLDSILWTDTYIDQSEIPAKKLRGVLSSLAQKGILILYSTKEKNLSGANESTLALTELGKIWMTQWLEGKITPITDEPKAKETKVTDDSTSKSQKNTDDSIITLKELIPTNMKGTKARRILRDANIERPYKQWEWHTVEHKELIAKVKSLLK